MQDRIRVADKNVYGDVPRKNTRCRTKRPVDSKAEEEQRKRLEAITARIQTVEKFLKSRDIKPYSEYSASEFDELKEIDEAVEKVIEEYGPTLKLLKET